MKTCNTCAWFCHSDGKCYGGTDISGKGAEYVRERAFACKVWTFDGLDDWERDQIQGPSNILVTVEQRVS